MTFQFGIDRLLNSKDSLNYLGNKRCALVAHPASITSKLKHSLDALFAKNCNLVRAFGPQHGMRGDKQDNMVETEDYLDPVHHIPIVSLYGNDRRPTEKMLSDLDVVLFDLQDVGCRIYTYITTLFYFLEECAKFDVELWVLDRPNPAGRPTEGLCLKPGEESFVGYAPIPIRHGLTTGELASWFVASKRLSTKLNILKMIDYQPDSDPGYGWPMTRPWINPSPNANSLNMARCFAGTVLLEGTELSEGRGTTIPLELIGAPGLPIHALLELLQGEMPSWLEGVYLRPCYFEPTFHKFKGEMCSGLQIHTDIENYQHNAFKPYRFIAGCFKALKLIQPERKIWRDHYYEYEADRRPIDVINGSTALRLWVDNPDASFKDFDQQVQTDLAAWEIERQAFMQY